MLTFNVDIVKLAYPFLFNSVLSLATTHNYAHAATHMHAVLNIFKIIYSVKEFKLKAKFKKKTLENNFIRLTVC